MTPRGSARTLATVFASLLMILHCGLLAVYAEDGGVRERPPYLQTPIADADQGIGDGTGLSPSTSAETEPDPAPIEIVAESPAIVSVAT